MGARDRAWVRGTERCARRDLPNRARKVAGSSSEATAMGGQRVLSRSEMAAFEAGKATHADTAFHEKDAMPRGGMSDVCGCLNEEDDTPIASRSDASLSHWKPSVLPSAQTGAI